MLVSPVICRKGVKDRVSLVSSAATHRHRRCRLGSASIKCGMPSLASLISSQNCCRLAGSTVGKAWLSTCISLSIKDVRDVRCRIDLKSSSSVTFGVISFNSVQISRFCKPTNLSIARKGRRASL